MVPVKRMQLRHDAGCFRLLFILSDSIRCDIHSTNSSETPRPITYPSRKRHSDI